MNLTLSRKHLTNSSTIGELAIDGVFQCYTLEDCVRDKKIAGITAIPEGTYRVIINMSNRFKRLLPLLLSVPNFEGVRIHKGNKAEDTEGCILVGSVVSTNFIGKSGEAFDKLFPILKTAYDNGEEILLTIKSDN